MGTVRVWMTIKGKKSASMSALAGTGAVFTIFPKWLAERVRLRMIGGYRVKYSDGHRRELKYASVSVTISGRTVPATILVSPEGGEILIGAATLATLGLAVDRRRRRLKVIHSGEIMAASAPGGVGLSH